MKSWSPCAPGCMESDPPTIAPRKRWKRSQNAAMSKVFTYQTRLPESSYPALDAYAMLYGQGERKLFAAMQSGRGTVNQLKRDCLCRFGITARQFNAVRVGLEGKVASIQE